MRTLEECLRTSLTKKREFYSREELDELIVKHNGFHAGDGLYFIKDLSKPGQIIIFHVWFGPETSSQPQGIHNEIGNVDSYISIDTRSFSSAVACITGDTNNYHAILKMFTK